MFLVAFLPSVFTRVIEFTIRLIPGCSSKIDRIAQIVSLSRNTINKSVGVHRNIIHFCGHDRFLKVINSRR